MPAIKKEFVIPDSTATSTLDCTSPIDTVNAPSAPFQAIDGAIALQTSSSSPDAMQTTATGADDPSQRLFAKTALFVHGSERSEILVLPEWSGRVRMWWGNTGRRQMADQFVVGPCHTDPDVWIVFPGGIVLAEPGCIDLIVRHDGRDTRVSMGVGAPCEGQGPPAEPSDS